MTKHIEQVEAINAERAAMPKEQRVALEAADAPLLRIQLAYAMQRAEDAEAKTGPTDALEQRLAAMEKLAAAWQKEAERARKDLADQAYPDDAIEFVAWSALAGPLPEVDIISILRTIRQCRYVAANSIHVFLDDWKAAKKRVTDLHSPVQHMGQTWCGECSVRRSTGPKAEEWVAYIPHPCPTLDALEGKGWPKEEDR
ncbi:hypothetical protein [Streptomyces olivochromogenes]|uniref:Uncharacterized protein n=1 Tax=Streptomyces olivochromogenes TaxID=1963 RepID=A0A250VTB9_STROL|nr:hypothetical protein [Streptomyces olivochromogenes]KUN38282.1 hypothetical protein AQJ27_45100 [Streptomyces olivochromogenes]GAX57272.1 hypothetical protein SO3561_08842 [Streptomyces olivochromogenes]